MKKAGIYIHVPFCDGKCPYCDFYSKVPKDEEAGRYTAAVIERIRKYAEKYHISAETVYFGGGTPNLIGGKNLSVILDAVRQNFSLSDSAEITCEVNPNSVNGEFFDTIRKAGFNRISMGLQSANEDELELLGRKHSAEDVRDAVETARKSGFTNISLDLMIGLPGQTQEKLKKSIDFCGSLGVPHVSSYILKIEERTPFFRRHLVLPDDDAVSDLYLFTTAELEKLGFHQYEISNYAKESMESRHNLIYWRCREYIGIGPGAHSYIDGKRFFYPRDFEKFIDGVEAVLDGTGGDEDEYIMLKLRLREGISRTECDSFRSDLFNQLLVRTKKIPRSLIKVTEDNISLTPEGFLVSNTIICELLGY